MPKQFFFCDDCIVFHITPKRRLFVNKPCAILWSATNISKTKCIPVAAFCTTNPVLNTLNRTLKNILKPINLPFLSSTPEFFKSGMNYVWIVSVFYFHGKNHLVASSWNKYPNPITTPTNPPSTPNHPQPPSPTTSPNRPQPPLGPRRCLRAGDSLSALQLPRLSFWGSARVPRLRARGPMTWMGPILRGDWHGLNTCNCMM